MFRSVFALVFLAGVVCGQYQINVKELCKLLSSKMGSRLIRDPRNCNRFYNCDGDLSFPVLQYCNPNLVFSQAYQVCVFPNSDFDDCKMIYRGRYSKSCILPFFIFDFFFFNFQL